MEGYVISFWRKKLTRVNKSPIRTQMETLVIELFQLDLSTVAYQSFRIVLYRHDDKIIDYTSLIVVIGFLTRLKFMRYRCLYGHC